MKPRVVVLGAGINGLTCALGLIQSGLKVTVIAEKFDTDTISGNAPGVWTPHAADPKEKILEWSRATYLRLKELMSLGWPVEYGSVEVNCAEKDYHEGFWWINSLVQAYTKKVENGECFVSYLAPHIRTAEFLKKQLEVFLACGGTLVQKTITSIPDLVADLRSQSDVRMLVNCLGHGSSVLFNDKDCFPIRGVLIKAAPVKGLPVSTKVKLNHPEGIVYITLRQDVCLLGGTVQVGNSSTTVTEEEAQGIISRCVQYYPDLNKNGDIHKTVTAHWAGGRPGRSTVRLELDTTTCSFPIVHNYGHGGSGWTLSYGCSLEVVGLVWGYLNRAKL